ncbi:hypothetical protein EV44_g2573 [Erysiphe necator]|uniref:Uncharacterized protein n=1 Tax=Uncinula necator TaxID=52586 RepID=A0A0B1P8S7_UNCNE|nr:hypothetical protein EV44_g2573 [Erysiphe necator]
MSTRLRQIKSKISPRLSRSCAALPVISPNSPQDQNDSSSCGINIPPPMSHVGNGRRQGTRTWKRKDRDANYWQRIYEYPNLNEEERFLAYLKGISGLPWKEIVVKFNEKMGLEILQPALQMRLTRLTYRMDTLWAGEKLQNKQETRNAIHPSYSIVNQKYAQDELVLSQGLSVDTAPISNMGPWPGMNDNTSYFITNPPYISQFNNSLYYDYNTERCPGLSHYTGFNTIYSAPRIQAGRDRMEQRNLE